jgi:hypothetical protein
MMSEETTMNESETLAACDASPIGTAIFYYTIMLGAAVIGLYGLISLLLLTGTLLSSKVAAVP